MTLRALVFDVDGTLADTESLHLRAFNRAFEEAGFHWHWDDATYDRLLEVEGGLARIRAWVEQNRPRDLANLEGDGTLALNGDVRIAHAVISVSVVRVSGSS